MANLTQVQGTHQWTVDPAHSSVDFSVRHMGVFTVRGTMGQISGSAETTDAKLTRASLRIDLNTIDTNNEQRDAHLKSADFLNVEGNPNLVFESTSLTAKSDNEYTISGNLTLAGQTHPFTVQAEIVEPVTDPWGSLRSGVTGSGVLKRSEWGVTYNSLMETGHLMISDEIKFTFDIQGTLVP